VLIPDRPRRLPIIVRVSVDPDTVGERHSGRTTEGTFGVLARVERICDKNEFVATVAIEIGNGRIVR
jgi:hypothetical protein